MAQQVGDPDYPESTTIPEVPDQKAVRNFCRAFWAFKLRERTTEPVGADYGIDQQLAERLARICQKEFERQVMAGAISKQKETT